MKNIVLIISIASFCVFFTKPINAQKGFFDINFGYNKYTTHFDKPLSNVINLNPEEIIDGSPTSKLIEISEINKSMMNINIGYNFHFYNGCYLGFYLNYSQISGNFEQNINFIALSPHLTYLFQLSKHIYYTPNCFISAGYCLTSAPESVTFSSGGITMNINFNKPPKYHLRFGINPLTFDYKLSNSASINLSLLSPMLNLEKYEYENKEQNQITKDIIFLYGEVGFKLYINKKVLSLSKHRK